MKQQDSQQVDQSQPTVGPGDRLQTARISAGMSVAEVAAKMHLSTCIIDSLEENNFEDITAPIFVKGYLRAYSRLVNLNDEEIIQQYTKNYMDGDPPITSTSSMSPELNADDSRVKWLSYIVILALIVLLSVWWWNRSQQPPETVSLESDHNVEAEVLAFDKPAGDSSSPNSEMVVEKESLQLEIKSVVDSMQLQNEAPAAELVSSSEPTEAIDSTIETDSTEMVDSVVVETTNDAISAEQAIPENRVAETLNEDVQSVSNDDSNLVITVIADTWASIKDVNGEKLVYDLLKSGETISVTGIAPISIFLGNGYGVTMTYLGKEVDLSTVIKSDNTARIKLGQ